VACDVMLQPYPVGINSRRTSVIATLSHGKAVVSNAGHLPELLWPRTGAVSLATEGDLQALSAETLSLLGQAERRAAIGQAAATLYKDMFETAYAVTALRSAAAGDALRQQHGSMDLSSCA
jgi:hypothetical protein